MRPGSIVVAIGLFAVLGGCGSGLIREPTVNLAGVQLAGLGLRGGTLKVAIEIDNPNRFALSTSEVRYHLAIAEVAAAGDTAWVDLATGSYAGQLSVGAGRSAVVEVPVEFTYAGLGSAAATVLRAGTFKYRATGEVDVGTPLGTRRVPFERGGVVDVVGAS
jgi:LEA14-like dessication related protein